MNTRNKLIIVFVAILQLVVCAVLAKNPINCLDKLKNDAIQQIYYMTVPDIINSHPASDTLSCYLKESRSGDKSIAEQSFNVYQKCNEYKKDNYANFGQNQLDELVSLGLPYGLEGYLRDQIKIGTPQSIANAIIYIQEKMSNAIEKSKEYIEFRKDLLKKIKPNVKIASRFLQEDIIPRKSYDALLNSQSDELQMLKEDITPKKSDDESLNGQSDQQQVLKSAVKSGTKSLHSCFLIDLIYWFLS